MCCTSCPLARLVKFSRIIWVPAGSKRASAYEIEEMPACLH